MQGTKPLEFILVPKCLFLRGFTVHNIQSTKLYVFVSVPGLISFSIDVGVGQEIDRAKTTCSFICIMISVKNTSRSYISFYRLCYVKTFLEWFGN